MDPNGSSVAARREEDSELPRAVLDVSRNAVSAWNQKFLDLTAYTPEELDRIKSTEMLVLSRYFDQLTAGAPRLQSCLIRCPHPPGFRTGLLVRLTVGRVSLFLDPAPPASAHFEQGRLLGREEERKRLSEVVHHGIAPSLMAALFLLEGIQPLETACTSPSLAKVSELLREVVDQLCEAIHRA